MLRFHLVDNGSDGATNAQEATMTDTTPADEPREGAALPQGDPTPEPPDPELDLDREGDVSKLRQRGGVVRRQLRQVEAERDALRERVDAHDREAVERIAVATLSDPSDLWKPRAWTSCATRTVASTLQGQGRGRRHAHQEAALAQAAELLDLHAEFGSRARTAVVRR